MGNIVFAQLNKVQNNKDCEASALLKKKLKSKDKFESETFTDSYNKLKNMAQHDSCMRMLPDIRRWAESD